MPPSLPQKLNETSICRRVSSLYSHLQTHSEMNFDYNITPTLLLPNANEERFVIVIPKDPDSLPKVIPWDALAAEYQAWHDMVQQETDANNLKSMLNVIFLHF